SRTLSSLEFKIFNEPRGSGNQLIVSGGQSERSLPTRFLRAKPGNVPVLPAKRHLLLTIVKPDLVEEETSRFISPRPHIQIDQSTAELGMLLCDSFAQSDKRALKNRYLGLPRKRLCSLRDEPKLRRFLEVCSLQRLHEMQRTTATVLLHFIQFPVTNAAG